MEWIAREDDDEVTRKDARLRPAFESGSDSLRGTDDDDLKDSRTHLVDGRSQASFDQEMMSFDVKPRLP